MKELDKSAVSGGLELPKPPNAQTVGDTRTVVTAAPYNGFDWRHTRDPQYHVYLFNVSERTFTGVGNVGGGRGMTIPGLSVPDKDGKVVSKTLPGLEDKPYRLITSFPQPMLVTVENHETNQWDVREQDVRRFIVDLISPDHARAGMLTLDADIDPNQAFAQGKNLARAGLFFDYTEEPSREQLEKAYARMDKYYAGLIEIARTLGLTDKPKFESMLRENPDFVFAAEYSGEEFDWHRKQIKMSTCSVCGEKKRQGLKFHMSSAGFMCIEPSVEGWKAAYNAGVKSKDQVPEDFRWWTPTKGKKAFEPADEV